MKSQTLSKTENERLSESRDLVITRQFDAPRRLVWKAWTEPEYFTRWWGPKDYTAPAAKIDLRVGGAYLACMRSAEGKDFWSTGTYREIAEPQRLVVTDSFADPDGKVVPASYYGMPGDWPMETQIVVTLDEHDGKTTMTLRHVGIPATEMGDMCAKGWNESLDKLADVLYDEMSRR